jgi:hypothetical protein
MIEKEKLEKLNELIRRAHRKWPSGECSINLTLGLPSLEKVRGSMSFNYKCENYPEIDWMTTDEIIKFLEEKVGP